MPSLRNKILHTYGFSKLVLLAFAAVVFADLYYLSRQIEDGQAVTDLREATLEMRRDEKNLFLYRDIASLDQLRLQAEMAEAALNKGHAVFLVIGGEARFSRIRTLLREYLHALEGYPLLDSAAQVAARKSIRDLGHELTETSHELRRSERRHLADVTRRAGLTLLLAFAGVVVLGVAGGLFLAHGVVRPLRGLQTGLNDIDEGRARELALPSRDQEIESFVASFNTMLKHMRQQQDQVKRSEKAAALGVLVSGVAHELNNPLSNISTSVQLLMEEDSTVDAETRAMWLAQIDSETERARRIVRRLLDSVRQPKLQVNRLSLADLLQSSLSLVNRQLPENVHVCVEADAELVIEVDRERMHQVFINLIKNAADAGARHIQVSADQVAWNADLVGERHLEGDPAILAQSSRAMRIVVADDGPGIAPEVCGHLFEPFVTTRSSGEGTGLGLYLVEEIVSEHRGCIVVDCRASSGTRFEIWLPLPEEHP